MDGATTTGPDGRSGFEGEKRINFLMFWTTCGEKLSGARMIRQTWNRAKKEKSGLFCRIHFLTVHWRWLKWSQFLSQDGLLELLSGYDLWYLCWGLMDWQKMSPTTGVQREKNLMPLAEVYQHMASPRFKLVLSRMDPTYYLWDKNNNRAFHAVQ